jgi:gliding motility-associated-like protein
VANYAWTINNVASGTTQTQSVDTSLPGTFEYEVTVTDPITSCLVQDSIIYTINPSPTFTSIATNTTACLANDGSIAVTITGPATSLFSYFITGPTSVPSGVDQTVGALPPATGLAAGTYGITVADQVSGCATIDTEIVNDNAFTITSVSRQNNCDPLILRVVHTAVTLPMTYRVINAATAQVVASGNASAGSFDVTPGVPSGNYIVELTAGGCVFSSPAQNFAQDAPVAITFNTTDICNGNLIADTAPAATSFDWSASAPGSLVTPGATTNTVAINPGQWLIRLTADDGPGGACPGTDSTTVTIDNFTPAFAQSDACQDLVTLTATPSGSYTYRWFRNNALIPGGRIITATAADDNSSYFVQVVSALNGCIKPSAPATVQVDGELTVSLVTTTPCEGSPFTLTATPNRSASFQWALDGALISGEIGPTLQEDRAGTYTVTASAATCTATADIEIILAPTTAGLLRDEAFICPDPANPNPDTRQVVLDPGDFTSYDWFKDGVNLGVPDPTFTADEPGRFSVNLINAFGCASTDRTDVIVQCDPVIVGPNAFRPTSAVAGVGGDMVNQSFKLFTFFIDDEDFQVFIFNRWGEMIFQSPERDFKWNGGYNNNLGQLLPPGTYSYVVRYKSSYRPEEGIQEKRGGVVLLR